ncbi:MAG: Rieske 2Fe-2S domain-containing protein [Spirochaetales bacterium]|nr:Rieske 2Fe-2S domain-containing protein [Spirochaetales bacterium]
MSEWIKISDFDFSDRKALIYNGVQLLLGYADNEIYCVENICSHEKARLSDGEYENGDIYCPKHGACFDIITGIPKTLPATDPLKVYEIKKLPDGVYILWNS